MVLVRWFSSLSLWLVDSVGGRLFPSYLIYFFGYVFLCCFLTCMVAACFIVGCHRPLVYMVVWQKNSQVRQTCNVSDMTEYFTTAWGRCVLTSGL